MRKRPNGKGKAMRGHRKLIKGLRLPPDRANNIDPVPLRSFDGVATEGVNMTGRYSLAARLLPWIMAVGFVCTALAAPAAEGKRLTTETEFRELVVDQQLTGDRTILWYTGDGRMTGSSRGKRIEGQWSWVGANLCRTATMGDEDLGYDCLAFFVINDLVVVVRDEGSGRAFALRLPNKGSQPGDYEEFACVSC